MVKQLIELDSWTLSFIVTRIINKSQKNMKSSVFYLAALHMVVCSTYGKVVEIVNNKPQLKERRKIVFKFKFWYWEIVHREREKKKHSNLKANLFQHDHLFGLCVEKSESVSNHLSLSNNSMDGINFKYSAKTTF